MIRHVPPKDADKGIGQRGSRIRESVFIGRAASMLGNQDRPQQGLSQDGRKKPIKPDKRVSHRDGSDPHRINRQLNRSGHWPAGTDISESAPLPIPKRAQGARARTKPR